MPDASFFQSSFLGGEWAAKVQGRIDSKRYRTAAALLYNYYPGEEGALHRRDAFARMWQTRDNDPAILIPFLKDSLFSGVYAWQIIIGGGKIRFLHQEGFSISPSAVESTIANISLDDPAEVTTDAAHLLSTGDRVYFKPNEIYEFPNELLNLEFTITKTGASTFTIDDFDGAVLGSAWTEDGTVTPIFELASPYDEEDIYDIKYVQTEEGVYLFHKNYQTRLIAANDSGTFSITAVDFLDGPYYDENTTSTTLTPGGTTGSISITASSAVGINDGTGFQTTDIGRLIRLKGDDDNWTWLKITAHTNATLVTATIMGDDLPNTNAVTAWRLGIFSDTTGWPSFGEFNEQRLLVGQEVILNRLDGSVTADILNFRPTAADGTIADDDAVSFTFSSKRPSPGRWITSTDYGVIFGTSNFIWRISAGETDGAITRTSVKARVVSQIGAFGIEPLHIGGSVLYVHRGKTQLREVDLSDGTPVLWNLSLVAPHLADLKLDKIVFQQLPKPLIWGIVDGGAGLITITYSRDGGEFNFGWARHDLGANDDGAIVEDISVMPATPSFEEHPWIITKRTVDGETVRFIEQANPFYVTEDTEASFVPLIDGGSGNGIASTNIASVTKLSEITVPGFSHLEGETLDVMVNGSYIGTAVVTDGEITITVNPDLGILRTIGEDDFYVYYVNAGYGYVSKGKLLRPIDGSVTGTSVGKTRRVHRYIAMLDEAAGIEFGTSFDKMFSAQIGLGPRDSLGRVPLFSGIVTGALEGSADFEGQICWRQSLPTPGVILGIGGMYQLQDRT